MPILNITTNGKSPVPMQASAFSQLVVGKRCKIFLNVRVVQSQEMRWTTVMP